MKGVLYNAAIMVASEKKNDDWEEVLKCRYNQVALGCCLASLPHSSSSREPKLSKGFKKIFLPVTCCIVLEKKIEEVC